MSDIHEFKVRRIGDNALWESMAVYDRQPGTLQNARKHAAKLANSRGVVEVRINALGSQQGHYVAGRRDARAVHRANAEAATMRGMAVSDIL